MFEPLLDRAGHGFQAAYDQFMEQINYQRALEGELARSIQSLFRRSVSARSTPNGRVLCATATVRPWPTRCPAPG